MRRTPAIAVLIAFVARLVCAQPAAPPPAFEVASIRPAPLQAIGRTSVRMSSDRGRLNYTNVSLRDVICQAYGVQSIQISGPDWLDTQRFDIVAKIPDGIDRGQLPRMFQALLADRFKLKLHIESKELPVYTLAAAKGGPKLQKAESISGLGSGSGGGRAHASGKVTMAAFADFLSRRLGRPVLDQTGLDGAYAVALEWAPDPSEEPSRAAADGAAPGVSGPSLFTALEEQLGLRLAAAKGPVQVLVIDHAEKVPTEN